MFLPGHYGTSFYSWQDAVYLTLTKGLLYQPFKIYGAVIMGPGICIMFTLPYYIIEEKDTGGPEALAEGFGWICIYEMAGMLIYLPSACYEAEYSRGYVRKYNYRIENTYKKEETFRDNDGLSFRPLIVWRKNTENERKSFDGLGICLKYRI